MRDRVVILRLSLAKLLQFGRAFLAQENRQDDERSHLQEFALPVLERGGDEAAGGQIGRQSDGRLVMLPALFVVAAPAGEHLAKHRQREQRQQ